MFGSDDTLLASCGDGASFIGPRRRRRHLGAYATQALAEGIITPAEDVGAYRAQLPSSLAGKILRLDPQSGDGVPGNPYYDPGAPRSARSRVFALGFRNPFRFTVRPNTGSHDRLDANPGSLYVGERGLEHAGKSSRSSKSAGYDSGWPVYEGFDLQPQYSADPSRRTSTRPIRSTTARAARSSSSRFSDLIVQDTLGTPSWPNPCNPARADPGEHSALREPARRPDLRPRPDLGPAAHAHVHRQHADLHRWSARRARR